MLSVCIYFFSQKDEKIIVYTIIKTITIKFETLPVLQHEVSQATLMFKDK